MLGLLHLQDSVSAHSVGFVLSEILFVSNELVST